MKLIVEGHLATRVSLTAEKCDCLLMQYLRKVFFFLNIGLATFESRIQRLCLNRFFVQRGFGEVIELLP